MSRTVLATFTEDVYKAPEVRELDWYEFIHSLKHTFPPAKLEAPMISPAVMSAGKTLDCVESIQFGVLDLDHATPAAIAEVTRRLEPYDAVLYTTWRQAEDYQRGLMRMRVMLPFTRPVMVHEWAAVFERLCADFPGADPKCKNANRSYFLPSLPVGAEHMAIVHHTHGTGAWDVDAPLVERPETGSAANLGTFYAGDPVPEASVKRLASRLAGSPKPSRSRLGGLLTCALNGQQIAQPGNRDNTLYDLAGALASQFPTGCASDIAEYFTLSFSHWDLPENGVPWTAILAEKIERRQHDIHSVAVVREERALTDREQRTAIGTGNERSNPYSPVELAEFESDEPMARRWCVQKGIGIYIFSDGTYVGPISPTEATSACHQWLAPSPLQLVITDESGANRKLTWGEIIEKHGRIVLNVEIDLCASQAYLETERCTIVEATARQRKLIAKYDPVVDGFIRLLGNTRAESLQNWIACLTELARAAPILYLMGETKVGKTTLINGLARVWQSCTATPLESAMGSFNEAITECPLIFGDEDIPVDLRGQPRLDELKRLATDTRRLVRRKFKPEATVRGALRLAIAGNNMRMLSTRHALTPADIEALANRFIFIEPDTEQLNAFWGSVGISGQALVESDRIARHALWLRETRLPLLLGGTDRLIIAGDSDPLRRAIGSGQGAMGELMAWVHGYLLHPDVHLRRSAGELLAARVEQGAVWLHPGRMQACWDHYLSDRRPERRNIARALRESKGERVVKRGSRGVQERYYELDTSRLSAWVETEGEDWSEVVEALGRDTDTLGSVEHAGARGLN